MIVKQPKKKREKDTNRISIALSLWSRKYRHRRLVEEFCDSKLYVHGLLLRLWGLGNTWPVALSLKKTNTPNAIKF